MECLLFKVDDKIRCRYLGERSIVVNDGDRSVSYEFVSLIRIDT
jgi:hypothetical protein